MTQDKWKVCALCRYLDTVDRGLEIDEILDTEYSLFHCSKLDVFRHEEYLMAPVTGTVEDSKKEACPYWEPWSADCLKAEERFVGLPDIENLESVEDRDLADVLAKILADDSIKADQSGRSAADCQSQSDEGENE
ncbi:MAG: hypothetical protein ACI38Q_04900 [Candidatus Bruticola sp.]